MKDNNVFECYYIVEMYLLTIISSHGENLNLNNC